MRLHPKIRSWVGALVFAGLAYAGPGFAAEPPLALYGALPQFEMASISPSGAHVAVLATIGGVRQVVVLDADRKPIYHVVIDAASKVRKLTWAGDQMVLINVSVTIGLGVNYTATKAEVSSVMVLPLDGSNPWRVFAGDHEITGEVWGSYGVVQKDGRWFGYFGGITLKNTSLGNDNERYLPTGRLHPDLYEVDLQSRKHRIIANKTQGDQDSRHWLLTDKGEVGATLDLVHSTGQWKVTSGQGVVLATGVERSGNVDLIGFTADGSGVIYSVRDAVTNDDRWFSVALAGGAASPFLDDVAIDRSILGDGHRLIGYIDDTANHDGHFFDPRHEKIYKASQRAFPNLRVVLDDTDRAFDKLLLKTEGTGDPETWWLVNIGTGHADPLGYSYALDPEQVGAMQMVPYTAADGLKMEGVLTLPPGRPDKDLPAVILPHGGPASSDEIRFDWIAQAYASRGYAVFQPNFRGSDGYGTAFREAGNGEWGRKMQTDISDGLNELVHRGIVDPKRVCIVGASYGGYAALAGVTLQHGIYRCAVAIAGLSDLNQMVNDSAKESDEDPMLMRNLKRELGSGRDLKAVSPVHFADKVDVPVLLIHGKDDTVVLFNQSTGMLDALHRAGKPVEMVTLQAEDHWLSKSATRMQMLQASVDFVMKHNPPDKAP